jgi:hypothetical protein
MFFFLIFKRKKILGKIKKFSINFNKILQGKKKKNKKIFFFFREGNLNQKKQTKKLIKIFF